MKTLLSSLLLASTLLLGCKKDSASTPTPAPELTGTWQREAVHTHRVNAAGTVTYDRNDTTIPATLVITPTVYRETANYAGGPVEVVGTYARSGSTITITSNGVNQAMTITELTADHLTLRQTNHDVDTAGDTETIDARYHH